MGFGLLNASRAELKDCLPEKMNARGYHSTAVHGYNGRMFLREEWYRRIGFKETRFREGLREEGLPVCPGPFPGICDAAAAEWIGDRLQRDTDAPQFIYWVTLNSHLPVPVSNGVKAPPACSDNATAAEDPAICAWYQLVFNVHRSVAQLALRETSRRTIFLVVGDHAPPFSSARLRSEFSNQVVPYFLLTPKSARTTDIRTIAGAFAIEHPWERGRKLHGRKGTVSQSSLSGMGG
jgi:phosphoglycerol transferase MdoB-like AlkP superfamily enzyme